MVELGPDQVLDEPRDDATGETTQTIRDLTTEQIARRDRKATIAVFLATDPGGDDTATAALRALFQLEGW